MKYYFASLLLLLMIPSCTDINGMNPNPPPKTGPFAIYYAQGSGNYSYCDEAENYMWRCIAETELEETLPVDYNCCLPSDCPKPSCIRGSRCGMGNGNPNSGCPLEEFCTVNPIWLCEQTGGVTIENASERYVADNFCICPGGEIYIENYGCANCDSFEHEETRGYCRQEKNATHYGSTYFTKYCDYESARDFAQSTMQ